MDTSTAHFFEQLTLLVAVGLLGPLLSAIPRVHVSTVIGELIAGGRNNSRREHPSFISRTRSYRLLRHKFHHSVNFLLR